MKCFENVVWTLISRKKAWTLRRMTVWLAEERVSDDWTVTGKMSRFWLGYYSIMVAIWSSILQSSLSWNTVLHVWFFFGSFSQKTSKEKLLFSQWFLIYPNFVCQTWILKFNRTVGPVCCITIINMWAISIILRNTGCMPWFASHPRFPSYRFVWT